MVRSPRTLTVFVLSITASAMGQPLPPPTPAPLTADQVAQRVQAFYDRTTDFQADFTQVSRNRLYGRDTRRSGHMMFRRAGGMRFDYAAPSGDLVVYDGATLTTYLSDMHQATVSPVASSDLPAAMSFLTGSGRLQTQFTFTALDPARFHFPAGYVLEGTPRTPTASCHRVLFYVDPTSFQVVRTAVINADGDENRFDLSSPRVNTGIPAPTFRWSPPPGTTVIHH